jgi:hypothetical protein
MSKIAELQKKFPYMRPPYEETMKRLLQGKMIASVTTDFNEVTLHVEDGPPVTFYVIDHDKESLYKFARLAVKWVC